MSVKAEVQISPGTVKRNGAEIFSSTHHAFQDFAKALYNHYNTEYPKFFKMDDLCKLAFLGAEGLLEGEILKGDTAIVLGNHHGSLFTDIRHQDGISDRQNYFPSPAVFVYTLPNIMLGEICIRHGITGENSCFLMDAFNPDFFHTYVGNILDQDGYAQCIAGWVNYHPDFYKVHLYLITRDTGSDGADVFANFE